MRMRRSCRETSRRREPCRAWHAVLLAEDVPGLNDVGAVRHDEVLLADTKAFYHGQLVALVVGATPEICRAAAEKVVVEYEPLPPIFTIEEAIAANSFHTEPNFIRRGDVVAALRAAPLTFRGRIRVRRAGSFLSRNARGWAEVGEDGTVFVSSSTQHPSEVQHIVAHVLKLPMHSVVVESPRMGGGFGGKETQAQPGRARGARGDRRPAARCGCAQPRSGHDAHRQAASVSRALSRSALMTNGTAARRESGSLFPTAAGRSISRVPVTDRALFHLDNAYYIPNVEFSGRVAKTNLTSNTAFRGFGGPQGMLVIEEILDRIARATRPAAGSRARAKSLPRQRRDEHRPTTARRSETTASSASGTS